MFSEKVSASFSCWSEKALSYAMSSPTLFSLLNSSANEVSKGPEETPLIPPFVSDKTGFTMMDHSGSSLHSHILFFESKMFCYILSVIACDQYLMVQDHLCFYYVQHFLRAKALFSWLLSFQQ